MLPESTANNRCRNFIWIKVVLETVTVEAWSDTREIDKWEKLCS